MNNRSRNLAATVGIIAVIGACGDDPVAMDELTIVTSMVPMAGATNVDVNTTIEFRFSNPMQVGMEGYVELREGDLAGTVVAGTWMWANNRTLLQFRPAAPLQHQFRYTMHMGGAFLDAEGRPLNYEHCINMHNAEWAHQNMMGPHHWGNDWQHPNGSYGVFTWFETG